MALNNITNIIKIVFCLLLHLIFENMDFRVVEEIEKLKMRVRVVGVFWSYIVFLIVSVRFSLFLIYMNIF